MAWEWLVSGEKKKNQRFCFVFFCFLLFFSLSCSHLCVCVFLFCLKTSSWCWKGRLSKYKTKQEQKGAQSANKTIKLKCKGASVCYAKSSKYKRSVLCSLAELQSNTWDFLYFRSFFSLSLYTMCMAISRGVFEIATAMAIATSICCLRGSRTCIIWIHFDVCKWPANGNNGNRIETTIYVVLCVHIFMDEHMYHG